MREGRVGRFRKKLVMSSESCEREKIGRVPNNARWTVRRKFDVYHSGNLRRLG